MGYSDRTPKADTKPRGLCASERGSALIYSTLSLPALLMMAGLAIDGTKLYIVQAQLQTAVDGAAHGALRLLGSSANASTIASQFLKANLPAGFWGSGDLISNVSFNATAVTNTINVSAAVQVPMTFMRILGQQNATVSASGAATSWNLVDCNMAYPSGSPPSLTSVVFNESKIMVGYGPNVVQQHGTLMAWYNDEHPLTLGVRQVQVISSGGTSTTNYPFAAFNGTLSAAGPNNGPLQVGSTLLTGQQAGTDDSTWTQAYGYVDHGRPEWPALFITDITTYTSSTTGDWQQGGTAAIPPSAIYGTWKGAVRTYDVTKNPAKITLTPDADTPTKNNWTGVPDTPPGGFPTCAGYCSEIVWHADSLGLQPGHSYRVQFIIHDGDQNQAGGDTGEGCAVIVY